MHIPDMTVARKIDPERGERIRHLRADILKLRSQQALADLLTREGKEVTRGAVGNWELGKEVGLDALTVLSRIAGVRIEWLAYNEGEKLLSSATGPREPANARITGEFARSLVKVPQYGSAVGGEDGEFVLNGNRLDDIFAPPSLSGIPNAYAVQISGSSMEPRYEDGETVFVNPNRRPVKGDYVIAEVHIEEHEPPLAYIKKLVKRTDKELVLEQFNPPKTLRFEGHRVKSVHYVLRSGE
ncbi:helix-turn-helix transcriptional regulator [Rhizobium sp. CNPSo 4062]|uniref:S24 family peptidase n=1 Tax=Rhizobium sp. CNPSo 4062 TaxID=3021410 RepID=UPI0025516710|nr:helix-turn-helix transcriptional regulator [Rhizobium sp. CNPSo 4062]MDK4703872.1 helix-turn-helix transcriptional regulator [Rhizobium sp. CNPSo 4062]